MLKIIGIIGVALIVTVAQPVVSAASRGAVNNPQFGVRTAPVQVISNRTVTTGPRGADQSFIRWVRHASLILFAVAPHVPR